VTTYRLHARPDTLAERVALRGRGGGPAIPGDELRGLDPAALRRISRQAAREAEDLDRAGAGDLRIDTDDRPPHEVAALIRTLWIPHPPA
jgi:chloramphenicol 3-O-phosphotransferase